MRYAAFHPTATRTFHPSRLAALCCALTLCFVLTASAGADGRAPGGNFNDPVVRQVDIAAPAVVRVATTFTGTLTFNLCGVSAAVPGTATLGATGSGAFITSNGDLLTADHVVDISHADLDSEWFQSPAFAPAIAAVLNAHAACLQITTPVTADDILNGYVQFFGIPFSTSYSEPTFRVWMNTAYSGPLSTTTSDSFLKSLLSANSLTATLERSSTFENDDVAILRVQATDTPFIQLGDSNDVAVQDRLTEIGFPGNADDFHPDGTYDPSDLLTPSFNVLYVSAIKSGVTNDTLLQVSGNIEHGDSGGPVLNAAGQIVGVVSYGGTDTPIGTFFLRTSNDALALAHQSNLNMQSGQFQSQWSKAFTDYASSEDGHWHTAAQELTSLTTSYPAFKGAAPYRDYANKAASTETSSGGQNKSLVIAIIGGAALLIVILLILLLVVLRRGSKTPTPAYAGYPSYSPYSQSLAPGGPLAPPYTPMQMPTSAEMVDLTRRQGGMQVPTSPSTANGSTQSAGVASNGAILAPAPQATPSYTPQQFAAPAPAQPAPTQGTQTGGQATYGAFGAPAESTTPMQRPAATSYCVNGHAMPPNEVYCGVCGAPRNPGAVGQWERANG